MKNLKVSGLPVVVVLVLMFAPLMGAKGCAVEIAGLEDNGPSIDPPSSSEDPESPAFADCATLSIEECDRTADCRVLTVPWGAERKEVGCVSIHEEYSQYDCKVSARAPSGGECHYFGFSKVPRSWMVCDSCVFACMDLAELNFGACEMLLGYAVVDGDCAPVSGCDSYGYDFYSDLSECQKICSDADPNGMCDDDPNKIIPGICGCGTPDVDSDGDGIADCSEPCNGHDADGDAICDSDDVALYYTARPDYRKCAYPMCGGYWVSPVNNRAMRCADGVMRAECYVVDIDFDQLGLPWEQYRKFTDRLAAGEALVQGTTGKFDWDYYGPLDELVATGAWEAATSNPPEGSYVALWDNGTRCFTYPCPYLTEQVLNTRFAKDVTSVDLSQAGATQGQVDAAYTALMQDQLIAVGENVVIPNQGPAGDGLAFVASQFYLPVVATVDDLACAHDLHCTNDIYDRFVSSPEECYCPGCFVPISNTAAERNAQSWYDNGCDQFECYPAPCPAPPEPACIEGQCTYDFNN